MRALILHHRIFAWTDRIRVSDGLFRVTESNKTHVLESVDLIRSLPPALRAHVLELLNLIKSLHQSSYDRGAQRTVGRL